MNKKIYLEEKFVLDIANTIPGVHARFSDSNEDHGYHKADVVLYNQSGSYYLQVSRSPKSKKQIKCLQQRRTFPIFTTDFYGNPLPEKVFNQLMKIISS